MTARTWWGSRWLAALERLVDPARLSQGRWHARSGRVVRLDVRPGSVVARLEGGRAVPRTVHIRLTPLSGQEWERVVDAMAAQARFGAQLLAGEMPDGIEDVFEAAGASLFPRARGDVALTCTCSDSRKGPCKHIAAVCYVLGERFDADPFLMFELRGRTRSQVTTALRARRATAPAARTDTGAAADLPEATLSAPAAFWSPPDGAGLEQAPREVVCEVRREAGIDALEDRRAAPGTETLPLAHLGAPAFWPDQPAFTAAMEAAYQAIARHAADLEDRGSQTAATPATPATPAAPPGG